MPDRENNQSPLSDESKDNNKGADFANFFRQFASDKMTTGADGASENVDGQTEDNSIDSNLEQDLLRECSVTGDERNKKMIEDLANLDHPDTQIGKQLAQLSDDDLNNQDTLDKLIDKFHEAGLNKLEQIFTGFATNQYKDHEKLTGVMAQLIDELSRGQDSIFNSLSVDAATAAEGKRRRAGQQILVIAKSYLLFRSLTDLNVIQLETVKAAVNNIYDSKTQSSDRPPWFTNAVADRLKSVNVANLTFADQGLLNQLAYGLKDRFEISDPITREETLTTPNPKELNGIEFIYRLCTDAGIRLTEVVTAHEAEVRRQQYLKEYEEGTATQFKLISNSVLQLVRASIEVQNEYGKPAIALERVGTLDQILRTSDTESEGWWKEYLNSTYSANGIVSLLSKLALPENLEKIAERMLDTKSNLYQDNDGSGHPDGRFVTLGPEKSQVAAMAIAERTIYAALLGVVKAHFLRSSEGSSTTTDSDRLFALTESLKGVAKGRAQQMLYSPLEAQPPFTPEQLRFCTELARFFKDNADNDLVQKRMIASMGKAINSADVQFAPEDAERQRIKEAFAEKKTELESILEKAERTIPANELEAISLLDAAVVIPGIYVTNVSDYLMVEGKGVDRILTVPDPKYGNQLEEEIQAITQQVSDANPNSLPITLYKNRAISRIKLEQFRALRTKLASLAQERIIASSKFGFGGKAFYPSASIVNPVDVASLKQRITTLRNSGQLHDNSYSDARLATQLKTLRQNALELKNSTDTKKLAELEDCIESLKILIKQSQEVVVNARTLAQEAASASMLNIFAHNEPLDQLNRNRNSQFYQLFQ